MFATCVAVAVAAVIGLVAGGISEPRLWSREHPTAIYEAAYVPIGGIDQWGANTWRRIWQVLVHLIFGRLAHRINYKNLNRAFGAFELEAKLFLQSCE
jgi:hypothetical protein